MRLESSACEKWSTLLLKGERVPACNSTAAVTMESHFLVRRLQRLDWTALNYAEFIDWVKSAARWKTSAASQPKASRTTDVYSQSLDFIRVAPPSTFTVPASELRTAQWTRRSLWKKVKKGHIYIFFRCVYVSVKKPSSLIICLQPVSELPRSPSFASFWDVDIKGPTKHQRSMEVF